jgi:hypothetical protein
MPINLLLLVLLELINDLQIQDSFGSEDELNNPTFSKTATVCKLAQLSPEIRMTLPVVAKK